jgi:hypothetical protein
VVRYPHETLARLERWASTFAVGGGPIGYVRRESAQPSAYADAGRPVPPYRKRADADTIDREEARLINRARAEGVFWGLARVSEVIAASRRKSGGSEHDVYLFPDTDISVVVRSTIKDSYGMGFSSPAQYLKRIEDYNTVFPEHPIKVIGVSLNRRGNGVVWTAQPFVAGREFDSESDLQQALEDAGWERISSNTIYRHKKTGVVISDAHSGNVLFHNNGLYPIDVIIEEVPAGWAPARADA